MLVSDIIEDAAANIPNSQYLRATDEDANTSVADISIAGSTFIIFNNLPTISTSVLGQQLSTYPVEIQLLELAEMDDNTVDGDEIRSRLIVVAQRLFNWISIDSRLSLSEVTEDYEMELNGNVKLYDTVMTGVTLSFDMYIDNFNVCPAN